MASVVQAKVSPWGHATVGLVSEPRCESEAGRESVYRYVDNGVRWQGVEICHTRTM